MAAGPKELVAKKKESDFTKLGLFLIVKAELACAGSDVQTLEKPQVVYR